MPKCALGPPCSCSDGNHGKQQQFFFQRQQQQTTIRTAIMTTAIKQKRLQQEKRDSQHSEQWRLSAVTRYYIGVRIDGCERQFTSLMLLPEITESKYPRGMYVLQTSDDLSSMSGCVQFGKDRVLLRLVEARTEPGNVKSTRQC